MSHFPATPTPTPRELTQEEKILAECVDFLERAKENLSALKKSAYEVSMHHPSLMVRNTFAEIFAGIDHAMEDGDFAGLLEEAKASAREMGL